MDWSKVTKEHVKQAIEKFIKERPKHPTPRYYYLLYKGEKLPSKYIRGMAYSIATGEPINLTGFSGGTTTVDFFKKYGYVVEKDAIEKLYTIEQIREQLTKIGISWNNIPSNSNSVQLKDEQSVISCDQKNCIVFYVTNKDFEQISNSKILSDSIMNFSDTTISTDNLVEKINNIHEKNSNAIICSNIGNEIINSSTPEEYLSHEARVYTNHNFEVVFKILTGYSFENKKYSIKNAVWIATAILSIVKYQNNPDVIKNDMYFKQSDIVNMAQKIADGKVDAAMVSQWTNADNDQSTVKYLKADQKGNSSTRRLSMWEEFDDKTHPLDLNMEDDVVEDGLNYSIKELFDFAKNKYPQILGRTARKNAFILTWNVNEYKWENYKNDCCSTQNGNTIKESWTCRSKKPQLGDDIFLTRISKGIMAHGYVVKTSYEAPHWNPEKAKEGKRQNHIDVKFDLIIDADNDDKYIHIDDLKKIMPEQIWSPEGSGIAIQEKYIPKLKKMWHQVREKYPNATKDIGGKLSKMSTNKLDIGLNTILCGPPGTGKTYNTILYAVAICSENETLNDLQNKDYHEVKKQYDDLKKQERIAFTTFHQSYGYEEFIEGIRPLVNKSDDEGNLQYKIESGVFKEFCDKAKDKIISNNSNIDIKKDATVWNVHLGEVTDHTLREECFDDGCIRIGWEDLPQTITPDNADKLSKNQRSSLLYFQEQMEIGDIVVSFRSRKTIDGIGIVTGEYKWDDIGNKINPRKRDVKWLSVGKEMDVYSLNGNTCLDINTVRYTQIKPADILALANNNSQVAVEAETQPYVFIIDEINRGNMSKIFGELITLVEDTKRLGAEEEMKAILPYSKHEFGIPSNVYILGTMNTADRSIAFMDTALRRRFNFIEMMPKHDIFGNIKVSEDGKDVYIKEMLDTINQRIEFLFDREHTMGHAFFMKLMKEENRNITTLAAIFMKSVIPLLQEYFYEDYEKIRLVLGDTGKDEENQFIKKVEIKTSSLFWGSNNLESKYKYVIQDTAFTKIDSYIGIANMPEKNKE